jgi:hypothetical protein
VGRLYNSTLLKNYTTIYDPICHRDIRSLESLGKAYFFGQQGLTEDTVEGIRLIKLASKNGFEEATDFLSKADGIQKCLLDVIDVLNRPRPSK